MTISPDNFVPSSAQSYVTVRLDSSCAEKQSSLDLISCEKAHTQARIVWNQERITIALSGGV